jgi:hypothetical protein
MYRFAILDAFVLNNCAIVHIGFFIVTVLIDVYRQPAINLDLDV